MAAVSLVEVDTAVLERDILQLRQTLSRTRAHIEALQEKMSAMNNMWEGPSSAAVQKRFRADRQRMLDLCGTLDGLIQVLAAIRQSYDGCEEQVLSVVDALRL